MSKPSPNSTTLYLASAAYTLDFNQLDRLASEFCGIALQVTNDDGDQIEVIFDGPHHKAYSEAFLDTLNGAFRREGWPE